MVTVEEKTRTQRVGWRLWLIGLLPIAALALMLAIFAFGNPLAMFRADLPPIETLNIERIAVTPAGFQVSLINGGPEPVTLAQVMVDAAFWQFSVAPAATIPRLGRASVAIPYPWVKGEPHAIKLVTSTGATFDGEVAVATPTPTPGWREFMAYGLVGFYVGVIPVALGLLWYPVMRRMGRRWLGGILALTVGLLVFLLIDTFLEVIELGAGLPGVFQGVPLALFAGLVTWLVLRAVGSSRRGAAQGTVSPLRRGIYLSGLIAFSIGLHNLGEGLAIGAAFALGEAALGSFLVIGFTLHNITEGVGIAAPLVPRKAAGDSAIATAERATPGFGTFVKLALLAGAPAIIGAWLGGFAFSRLLAVLFLGIGLGAIWQVIVEVVALLRGYAAQEESSLFSWINVGGFLAGLAIMYFTAFLVKF